MRVCDVCLRCYDDTVESCLIENHTQLTDGRIGNCEIIPDYKLESLIEIVELYEVYSAINLTNNQPCSIKIISEKIIDDHILTQQILKETQTLSVYQHANLVNVYESGILPNGDIYIVSELSKGQTLRQSLSNVGVPAEITAVTIARQSLEGLEALHSLNLIHRNINPDNIVLTTDAESRLLVKIQNIDFGGINQKFTSFNLSNDEENLNKIKYFSPEQCMFDENVNHLTDIYSLGAVLYEMLTGKPPFDSSKANEIIEKHLKESIPPIHIANFNIRALLTHILTLSLQKHPISRHKTANTFARQLRHLEQIVSHSLAPPAPVLTKVAKKQPNVQVVTTQKLNEILAASTNDYKENNQPVLSEEDINDVVNAITPTNLVEFSVPTKESVDSQENSFSTNKAGFTKAKPTLIEWNQPEDIPLETEIPQVREYPQKELEQYEFYNAEDFVTNSPDRDFEDDEFEDDDYKTTVIPVVANSNQISPKSFIVTNQMKWIGGGAVALLALIVFGGFLENRIFSSDSIENNQTTTTVSEKKPTQLESKNQMIAKDSKEQSTEDEVFSNQGESESQLTNLEETTKRLSTDIIKEGNQLSSEKEVSLTSKKKEDAVSKEKSPKEAKNTQINFKLDKKGNSKPIKEVEKTEKADNFSRPRVVNENPRVKITDNLKDSAKNDTKKKPN